MIRKIHIATLMFSPILLLGQGQAPLTNADIVKMFRAGLPEGVITGAMKANDTVFDLSPDQLVALNRSGLTATVLEAMLEAGAAKRGGTNTAMPPALPAAGQPVFTTAAYTNPPVSGAQFPNMLTPLSGVPTPAQTREATVSFVSENASQMIPTERLETVKTTAKTSKLAPFFTSGMQDASMMMMAVPVVGMAVSGIGAIGTAVFHGGSGNTATYLWGLPGGDSNNAAPSGRPKFEVNFAGIPGVNPDEFEPRIIRLNPTKDNWRLVGVTQMKEAPSQGLAPAWPSYSEFVEEAVASKLEIQASGHVFIIAEQRLEPGQYAIVLRPAFKGKKFSAEAITKNQGEGVLFNSAWSFSVGMETPAPKPVYQMAASVEYRLPHSSSKSDSGSVESLRTSAVNNLGASAWESITDSSGVSTYLSPDRKTMVRVQDTVRSADHVVLVERFELANETTEMP